MNFEQHDIEWSNDKISRFWDFISSQKSLNLQFFGLQAGAHVAAEINRNVPMQASKNILDMSCGKGDILNSLLAYLKHQQMISGTDFSAENITYVKNRFKNNAQFKTATLLRDYPAPFADGLFDLIIATEVVEHLDDKDLDGLLKEAHRLLKPGGYICITTPNDEDLDASKVLCPDCGCVFHRWQHVRKWTLNSLQQKLEACSYQTKLIKTIAWGSPLKLRFALKLAVLLKIKEPGGLIYFGVKEGK